MSPGTFDIAASMSVGSETGANGPESSGDTLITPDVDWKENAEKRSSKAHGVSRRLYPITDTRRNYGVELLMAVTFCTEIEYIKRNSLVGLGHKVAFCSVSNGDEITLYRIAFPARVCIASQN